MVFAFFELILLVMAAITFGRMAEQDRGEGLKWGLITAGICLVSFFLPAPFLRMLLAIVIAFVFMTFSKKTYY